MKKEKNIKIHDVYKYDQFFTKETIAKECIKSVNNIFNLDSFDLIIEPSAGDGSFFKNLPSIKTIGIELDYDLCEKYKDYLHKSFFDFESPNSGNVLVIGNPPFGTQNSLSIGFFNHASKFAHVIAFIIPKTWKKNSVQNRLDLQFHLIQSIDLPSDCFYGNKDTGVKCCFQIWEKTAEKRDKVENIFKHNDWDFLSYKVENEDLFPPEKADFVILAYGSNSGQISSDLNRWRPKSVHFIKANKKLDVKELINRFNSLNYEITNDSARQSSLGRADLVRLYTQKYGV